MFIVCYNEDINDISVTLTVQGQVFFFFLLLFCLFQIRCVYWICPGLPVVLRRVWTGEPPLSLFLDLSVEEVFALIELRMVGKGLTFLIFYFFFRMETFFITNRKRTIIIIFFPLKTFQSTLSQGLHILIGFHLKKKKKHLLCNWVVCFLFGIYLVETQREKKMRPKVLRSYILVEKETHFISFHFICYQPM